SKGSKKPSLSKRKKKNERMTEMFSLVKELTKSNSPEKMVTESDMVIDENVVEPVKLVDKEKAINEEKSDEPNGRIAEDVLIDVADLVYPIDFVILDIEEDECMSLILGTPFLTTEKAKIKFDRGRMTIWSENCEYENFRMEERIKNHQEKEMALNKWKGKVFNDNHLIGHNFFIYEIGSEGCEVNDEGVT
ncbi:reverse transcriptase domain-containing protein, partial [Tanacetum coccineum]